MKTRKYLLRLIVIIVLVAFQQVFVVGLGLLVYDKSSETIGILIWFLCLPMVYLNHQTYKYVMKYGFINFITINADTSEIDVPKNKRWYNEENN